MFNGEIIFHKKDTEKVGLLHSERHDIKFRSEKLCAHFYHAPKILLWGTKYCARKQFCSNTPEGMNWTFLFPRAGKVDQKCVIRNDFICKNISSWGQYELFAEMNFQLILVLLKIVSFLARWVINNEDSLLIMYYHTEVYYPEYKISKIHEDSLELKILEEFNSFFWGISSSCCNFFWSIASSCLQMFFKKGVGKI